MRKLVTARESGCYQGVRISNNRQDPPPGGRGEVAAAVFHCIRVPSTTQNLV